MGGVGIERDRVGTPAGCPAEARGGQVTGSAEHASESNRAAEGPVRGHVGAWALWLLAVALPALTTRNPAYLLLLVLAVAVVHSALPAPAPQSAGWSFFLKAGLFLWLITIPLNALTVHYGDTVLFTLPRSLPLVGRIVGGPITLEAAAYGFLSGLGLLAILVVFVTFNRAVDPYQLLRATPPFLFQTGVMTSIALSFVPQAAAALREIREAQAIRGHRWRGLRDLLPLLMPLLTTGLERALQLAESMEARGFGTTPVRNRGSWRWGNRLLPMALLALLAGLLLRGVQGSGPLGDALIVAGGIILVAAVVLNGRSVARTRHHRRRWSSRDTAVALCGGLAALAYIAVRMGRPEMLSYTPYPRLHWPGFQPALGIVLMALTAPAWFYPGRPR